MSRTFDVAVLCGSLRKASHTRASVRALMSVAPASMAFRFVDIASVGHYNQDLDGDNPPADWAALRAEIRKADAVLFATPEYNRSAPGVLKNAIDIASRPHGKNAFDGKPAAVMSISPGALGAFGANHHLRQSLTFLNMPVLQQPEMYVGRAAELFDGGGGFKNDDTRKLFVKFAAAFEQWIARAQP